MIPRYEQVSHTADTGIITRADSLETVIANAAFAMFDLMYSLDEAEPGASIEMEVAVADPHDLLVAVLSELLYRSEVDEIALADIEVLPGVDRVIARGRAIPTRSLELRGPPIKAVTYHGLVCERAEDGWIARVVFDV